MLDGCNCCPMCAKQLGDSCENPDRCDHRKNLYCDLGNPPNRTTGVCKSTIGAPCYHHGKAYENGETHVIGCLLTCTCTDTLVVCRQLCPKNLGPPSPDCLSPRKVKPPGKCCEEWVCDDPKELTTVGTTLATYGREDSSIKPRNCQIQSTQWTACSRTCGTGISFRMTNDNADCTLARQERICIVRPCEAVLVEKVEEGKICTPDMQITYPFKFQLFGCTSLKTYRLKACGVCTDGRCCTPNQTITLPVEFRCPYGEILTQSMMFIKSCVCHNNCPAPTEILESLT
ncbi:CCN family member 2-like [Tenrec ecaudatus]|uniref:CCN family member 2-like n=1 Tax=Tenrec ecaudatus TaxID=94439 RepID=UPI003F5A1FEC